MGAKINFVVRHMEHHSRFSGYDRLVEFVPGGQIVDVKTLPAVLRLALDNTVFHSFIWRASGVRYYSPRAFLQELAVARLAQLEPGQIFHFIYGEDMYRYSGLWKNLLRADVRLVCTFHQPPSWLRCFIRSFRYLKYLDAAIIVGRNQHEVFSSYIGDGKVFFVPHGIDTDFFRPYPESKSDKESFVCITVGWWLRDFDTLQKVIRKVNAERLVMRFIIVTPTSNFHFFQDCIGVECKSGLSDSELRDLYTRADVLLLPLIDCTANNSLLEGIACGLPVVVTDVGGSRDYVDESCAILTPPGDADAMAEALLALQADPDRRRSMSIHSRRKALALDWKQVAGEMMKVYHQVLS